MYHNFTFKIKGVSFPVLLKELNQLIFEYTVDKKIETKKECKSFGQLISPLTLVCKEFREYIKFQMQCLTIQILH